MKLSDWINERVGTHAGAWPNPTEACRWLSEETGVSLPTVNGVYRGMRLSSYRRAKALSDATGGAVTVEDLCE